MAEYVLHNVRYRKRPVQFYVNSLTVHFICCFRVGTHPQ